MALKSFFSLFGFGNKRVIPQSKTNTTKRPTSSTLPAPTKIGADAKSATAQRPGIVSPQKTKSPASIFEMASEADIPVGFTPVAVEIPTLDVDTYLVLWKSKDSDAVAPSDRRETSQHGHARLVFSRELFVGDGDLVPSAKQAVQWLQSQHKCYAKCGVADAGLIRILRSKLHGNSSRKLTDTETHALEKQIDAIFIQAIKDGASDIHFEVHGESHAKIRYRVDGVCRTVASDTRERLLDLASVAYSHMGSQQSVPTFQTREPADWLIVRHYTINGKTTEYRFRAALLAPAFPEGFDITMRVIATSSQSGIKTPIELGYTKEQHELLIAAMDAPDGVVIVSGATGSGKSTTLQNLLRADIRQSCYIDGKSHEPTAKYITIENPTEYEIPGATQIGVGDGQKFQDILKVVLRSDPDCIMVGEIRDHESAKLVQFGAQTGHKILCTIHSKGIHDIPGRLCEIGFTKSIICSVGFLQAALQQTLVPTLCIHCKLPLTKAITDQFFRWSRKGRIAVEQFLHVAPKTTHSHAFIRNPKGCEHCHFLGTKGRRVVAEVIRPTESFLEFIRKDDAYGARRHWAVNERGITMLQHGLRWICAGEMDPETVYTFLGRLDGDKMEFGLDFVLPE